MTTEPIKQKSSIRVLPRKKCEKCARYITNPNHERHYLSCKGLPKKIPLSKEVLKEIPATCPNCSKEFKNIYSMSSHKAHCMGLNDVEHLKGKREWNKDLLLLDLKDVFSNDPKNTRKFAGTVKKYFIKLGYQEYRCNICGITDWCGKKLNLELDHINGDHWDNRLENLRLLCLNCHSQTPTYRGRNKNTGLLKVSDEDLLRDLLKTNDIKQTLINLKLTTMSSNYDRCKKLLELVQKETG